jgi:hypothetical protein
MKIIKWNVNSILAAAVVVSSIIFMSGCGEEVADSQGCPSGSYLANSTDTINIPEDSEFDIPSAVGAPASPQTVPFIIPFTVTDAQGIPRNNICVRLYTGFAGALFNTWYSDDTFSTIVSGSGPMQGITVVTNDAGAAFLFWTTTTPAANFASGTTAGDDITGNSWISFDSGALSSKLTIGWTVQGEPAP